MNVDLSSVMNECNYQGDAKSCMAFAVKHAYEIIRRIHNNDYHSYSAQYVYYNARLAEGNNNLNVGVKPLMMMEALLRYGMCLERDFPYEIDLHAESPAPQVYLRSNRNKVTEIKWLHNLVDVIECLDAQYPVIMNYQQHASQFVESVEANGLIPMPKEGDFKRDVHAVCVVGYDGKRKLLKFANSYGSAWGDCGYGYLPFDFALNKEIAGHFWSFRG